MKTMTPIKSVTTQSGNLYLLVNNYSPETITVNSDIAVQFEFEL